MYFVLVYLALRLLIVLFENERNPGAGRAGEGLRQSGGLGGGRAVCHLPGQACGSR